MQNKSKFYLQRLCNWSRILFFDTRTRCTFVFKFVSLKFQAVLLEIPIISSHVLNTWQFFFITKWFFTLEVLTPSCQIFRNNFFLTNAKVWFLTCSWHWTTNLESTYLGMPIFLHGICSLFCPKLISFENQNRQKMPVYLPYQKRQFLSFLTLKDWFSWNKFRLFKLMILCLMS